jgi:GT2 family glycosyltransferase
MIDLSIVIPTFDTAPMTLRCCQAVLGSMPASCEVIVVDDGSSDGTAELLAREAAGVQIARLESNRGFAAAANRGVAAARGRIILLLNSDAIVEANALRAFVAAFDDDERLGVAGASLLNDDGTPQWSGGRTPTLLWMIGVVSGAGHLARLFRVSSRAQSHSSLRFSEHASRLGSARHPVDWVSGAAMAFRADVWREAGPLSERYRFYCQDIEFSLRARAAGWGVRIVEEARVTHAIGATIAGGNSLRHDPERLWPDLLTWGRDYYGRSWSRVARATLIIAGALRVAWSALRRDAATAALLRGLNAIRRSG